MILKRSSFQIFRHGVSMNELCVCLFDDFSNRLLQERQIDSKLSRPKKLHFSRIAFLNSGDRCTSVISKTKSGFSKNSLKNWQRVERELSCRNRSVGLGVGGGGADQLQECAICLEPGLRAVHALKEGDEARGAAACPNAPSV